MGRTLITCSFNCRKPLPEPKPGQHVSNKLDQLTASYRAGELEHISGLAANLQNSATDVVEALNEVENFLAMLKNLAQEVMIIDLLFCELFCEEDVRKLDDNLKRRLLQGKCDVVLMNLYLFMFVTLL